MNKKNLLTILIMFIPITLFSQIKITGKIVNQKKKALELAEVIVLSKDSIALKSELTDVNGEFALSVEKGDYLLQIRQLNTILWKQRINIIHDLNIGIIAITENEQHLAEVVVMSKKKLIERKVDRLVFNVENSIAATGGDALDALKVTPGIRVQNDVITMIGKSGMAVMIDDKIMQFSGDDLINFLKTIPSDNIKSIEVITTPPAKYDAEGNSGIVNIQLKKIKKDSWNASVRSTYTQTTYSAGSIGGGFNFDKNKTTVNTDLGFIKGSISPTYNTTFFYPNQTWMEENTNRNYYNIVRAKLGVNYRFTEKFNIGMQYIGSHNSKKNRENDLSTLNNNISNNIDSLIVNKAENKIKNKINSLGVYSIYKLDSLGKKISFNFNYLNFSDNQDRLFNSINLFSNNETIPNSYFSANNISEQKITNFSGKIDIDFPTKFVNLSFGGKASFTNNNNELVFYNLTNGNPIFDPLQSNLFIYKENTEAVYISGSRKWNDKWDSQLGFRFESTQTQGSSITLNQINNNNYMKLFPTAYLSYSPNENNTFSINYGKRLNRPGFEYLNPFRIYNNKYQYSEGNPSLQPSYSHNLEFNYTYKNNWNSKFYYSKILDGTGGIIYINPSTNLQANIILNYLNSENIGFSESYTISYKKWFQSYNSFNVFYSNSKSTVSYINSNITGTNANITTNNNFIFNKEKTILFGINYAYNFKGVSGVNKISAYSQLDASIKFLFLNKNLSLTLIGNDILKSSINVQTTTTNNYQIKYKNYEDIRMFRFSMIFKFGNKDIKANKVDVGGNEEERNRLKK
jgi:hypothetical protein